MYENIRVPPPPPWAASLLMPNADPGDDFFYPTITLMTL